MFENENEQEFEFEGEADLAAAIASLKESENNEDNEDTNEEEIENTSNEDSEEDSEESTDEESDEQEEEVEQETEKKKQSKEDNAKFAAKRRQEELDRKVQEKLDEMKQADPNFLLAQQLSEIYGDTPENILAQLKESQLQKRAETEGVSVERLRKEQESDSKLAALETEINTLRYQSWKAQIDAEAQTLKTKYTMLDEDDIQEAVNYILGTAKDVNIPLTQAVYALHGEKIIEATVTAKAQDQLADQSGRSKKTPPPPKNGKSSNNSNELSDMEKSIARKLGISFDDYYKNK